MSRSPQEIYTVLVELSPQGIARKDSIRLMTGLIASAQKAFTVT